ncbi:hypothetical protein D3C86_2188840 [compost metagenome]
MLASSFTVEIGSTDAVNHVFIRSDIGSAANRSLFGQRGNITSDSGPRDTDDTCDFMLGNEWILTDKC